MHAAGKIFFKTYLKGIRDTFFPNMWYFYPAEGKSLGLQGDPPSPQFPRLVGHPILPMKKSGWSAYCNDFFSKQEIYSM